MAPLDAVSEPGRATIAVFDLDGTLTQRDTFRQFLLLCLRRRPLRWLRCWHLPADLALFAFGRRDNAWLKTRFLGAVLGGAATELETLAQDIIDRVMATGMRPGAVAALRRHQAAGHRTLLLSASPDIYVTAFAARLGFDDCICTIAERDAGGRLTGRLDGDNCYGEEKRRRLERFLGATRRTLHVIAYADQLSDLALMRWADAAVLVNPSPRARQAVAGTDIAVVVW
jgi:phosphatidylglycerophosphatase C